MTVRMYIPPNFYQRFNQLNKICQDKRSEDSNLKTQIPFRKKRPWRYLSSIEGRTIPINRLNLRISRTSRNSHLSTMKSSGSGQMTNHREEGWKMREEDLTMGTSPTQSSQVIQPLGRNRLKEPPKIN